MDDRVDLFTLGEALAVFIAADGLPVDESRHFRRTIAGSELNVAVALTRLGLATRYVTRVSDDGLGRAILSQLRAWGVDAYAPVTADAKAGIIVRDVSPGRRPVEAVHARMASAARGLTPDDVESAWPSSTGAVFVSGITGVLSDSALDAAESAARRGREAGAMVVLDPNLRLKLAPLRDFVTAFERLVPLASVVVAGEDELCAVTGVPDARAAARGLLDRGVGLVVGKAGADGSWAIGPDGAWSQAAVNAPVVDTVGAGDAFAAGVISVLLAGGSVAAALDRGAVVASFVVSTHGDVEGLPSARMLAALDERKDADR